MNGASRPRGEGGRHPGDLTARVPSPVPPTGATAASARAHARAAVEEAWGATGGRPREEDLIDLSLVVSEMVTNAIRHGGGLTGFEVSVERHGVRLAVSDRSDAVPDGAYGIGGFPRTHGGNGYGWPLINRLAEEVTVRHRPRGGKTISARVPLRPALAQDPTGPAPARSGAVGGSSPSEDASAGHA
ncbi:ATP-binding protein [Streptomyces longwoodensis]|uniref:ATP-binding protein n=1 Tax=Streptomyces longwoodensis TaxID=68231 RepID=UPI002E8159BD|nr:ATP-binding protein [Streptomyces longwoodensis]WUC61485.1 ATP-binding protein [Streptomyces longwoodensis]